MAFTLSLMRAFPSSRTRDAVWVLSSFSIAILYGLLRFSRPERLIRPDMMAVIADYLRYLQAPTAPYAPSWWLTQGLGAYASGQWGLFVGKLLELWTTAAVLYGAMILLAGRVYAQAYSGAQESPRIERGLDVPAPWEARFFRAGENGRVIAALFARERRAFFRDVKHWSQILLIGALMFVYLFSISRLPLDTPELKDLVCFLNIGAAGFVLCSLGLRFTFPAISLEGRSYWVVRAAPIDLGLLMRQKFLFSFVPTLALATALVAVTNHLLKPDAFIAWLTLATIWLTSAALCGLGVGLGACFPRFNVENIHQIESSAGGFVYMACALGMIALTLALEAIPVQMHLQERLGRLDAWQPHWAAASAAVLIAVNAAAVATAWTLGRRNLEAYEPGAG